jgi:hypothetical protein
MLPVMQEAERSGRLVKRVMLGCAKLVLQSGPRFEREIYADGPIHGGARNVYCALLSTGDIVLGDESAVLRWTHAEGAFTSGAGAMLRVTPAEALRQPVADLRLCYFRQRALSRLTTVT